MGDANVPAPLVHLRGERPPAPAWFVKALEHTPERSPVEVKGARIEALTWGEVGRPGLLLLHGGGAHADWWSFIAPLFADVFRVAALSWSGMGGSDWRDAYAIDVFAEEAFAVAEQSGLFASETKPVFLGHSFGGVPTLTCAALGGERLRAAIVLDTPILSPERRKTREAKRPPRREPQPTMIYPTFEAAVMRFRFLPPQACENLFIADHIARTSLKPVKRENGEDGWTWRFDPFLWDRLDRGDPTARLKAAKCPVAFMWGAHSRLFEDKVEVIGYMRKIAPAGTPFVEVPEAHHHVMVDQPLAFVATVRGLLAGWPQQANPRAEVVSAGDALATG